MNDLIINIITAVSAWIVFGIAALIAKSVAKKGGRHLPTAALVKLIFGFAACAITVFILMDILGVPTMTSTMAVGAAVIILGLGTQSIFEDLITGMFQAFEKKFKPGDIMIVEGFKGVVTDIGARNITLEDPRGNRLVINHSDIRSYQDLYWERPSAPAEEPEKETKEEAEEPKESVPETTEAAVEEKAEAAEKIEDEVIEAAEDAAETLQDEAEDKIEEVKETVENEAEEIKDVSGDTLEAAAASFNTAAMAVDAVVSSIEEAVGGTVGELREVAMEVGDAAAVVADAAEAKIEEVKETAEELPAKAKKKSRKRKNKQE